MFQNRLLQSFLSDKKTNELYQGYLENPTIETKDLLEKSFQIHVRKFQLLSYFSQTLFFESQRYDKKIRRNKNLYQLVLDKDASSGESKIVDMIPDEKTKDGFEIMSYNSLTHLELVFEDKQLYEIVSNLTQRQKDIVYAVFIENETEDKIANRLGITKQAVNKTKNQALRKIKQEYEKLR